MKRKALCLLLTLITLFVFVSCSPNAGQGEALVNVHLSQRGIRALTAVSDFDIADCTWKYTAVKSDNGLDTGASVTEKELPEDRILTLSKGYWNFVLYGYKDGNLICKGSVTGRLISDDNKTVSISVEPLMTLGVKGTINIALGSEYSWTVIDLGDGNVVEGTSPYSVQSGTYMVKVVKDGATSYKYLNVYDYLTTTVTEGTES